MAVTPIDDLTVPMNIGYDESDTAPIIHSVRWRHLPSRFIFTDVNDVVNYHQRGPLVIDIKTHSVSYLDVYFRKDANITEVRAYLRFTRETDDVLIEEPYTVGEGGRLITLTDDTVNSSLQVMRGIAFTQRDLNDGTPMYDFMSMTKEGLYEVWIRAKTSTGNELHVRIPFQWANLEGTGDGGTGGGGGENPSNPDNGKLSSDYDEFYVTIVEGSSPFTKRPSTHFRMAGIGMLQTPNCFERIETPRQSPISRPVDKPIVGDVPAEPCGLQIIPTTVENYVGEVVEFDLIHSNKSDIVRITSTYETSHLEEVSDTSFKVLSEGTQTIQFTVVYSDGQECAVSGTVIGTVSPTDPNQPEPQPFTCELSVTGNTSTEVGTPVTLILSHGSNTGGEVTVNVPPEVTQTGDYTFTSATEGAFTITFNVAYPDGVCEKEVIIEFTSSTQQPEPPPPGTLYCGDDGEANGDTGFGEFTHLVTEEGVYYIEYNFLSAADRMYVYAGGNLIHDTGLQTYSNGSPFGFNYKPSDGQLVVRMNDGEGTGTNWNYTMYCPSNVPEEVRSAARIVN